MASVGWKSVRAAEKREMALLESRGRNGIRFKSQATGDTSPAVDAAAAAGAAASSRRCNRDGTRRSHRIGPTSASGRAIPDRRQCAQRSEGVASLTESEGEEEGAEVEFRHRVGV